jgi:hypothetical protein
MKILRFALVLIAYAGWLAWPFLHPSQLVSQLCVGVWTKRFF